MAALRGETAPMTTAAAPCSHPQVRSLPCTVGRAGRPGMAGCAQRNPWAHILTVILSFLMGAEGPLFRL